MEEERRQEVLENDSDEELTTSVDQLLDLLKTQEKIPLNDAAKQLGVTLEVVQSWVDFLVEEQIVGIEYKFTKPYIYLNNPGEAEEKKEEAPQSFESMREDFVKKAQKKNIPHENIKSLWRNHVGQALERKEEFFMAEAEKRGIDNSSGLWKEYKRKLLGV